MANSSNSTEEEVSSTSSNYRVFFTNNDEDVVLFEVPAEPEIVVESLREEASNSEAGMNENQDGIVPRGSLNDDRDSDDSLEYNDCYYHEDEDYDLFIPTHTFVVEGDESEDSVTSSTERRIIPRIVEDTGVYAYLGNNKVNRFRTRPSLDRGFSPLIEESDDAIPSTSRGAESLNLAPVTHVERREDGSPDPLSLISSLDINGGGYSSVMAHSSAHNLMAVSVESNYNGFSGYGLELIDVERLRPIQFIPAHRKLIKCMDILHRGQPVLLTASLDGTAQLMDLDSDSNPVITSIPVEEPLWSCCHSETFPNMFHIGSQDGRFTTFDYRNVTKPYVSVSHPEENSPTISLVPVPPSTERSFSGGGLLSCHHSNCFAHEHSANEVRRSALSSPFTSVSYEPDTEHFLFSTRASSLVPYSRYYVCQRAYPNDPTELRSCGYRVSPVCKPPVRIFSGGSETVVKCRPCLTSIGDDLLLAAYMQSARTVALWNVRSARLLSTLPFSDFVGEILPLTVNGELYIAILHNDILKFYKYSSA